MQYVEQWGRFDLSATGKVVLILDSSESAAEQSQSILELAQLILRQLPSKLEKEVYFLGNPQPYRAGLFDTLAGQWLAENHGRMSLVAPILEHLAPQPGLKIVVIGAGCVFDIADWQDSPLAEHLLLVTLGESLQDAGGRLAEVSGDLPDDVCRQLYSRVTRVAISGVGFLPLLWDNPAYRLVIKEEGFVLCAEDQEDYRVALRCLSADPRYVEAAVTFSNNASTSMTLTESRPFPQEKTPLGALSQDEASLFLRASRNEPFTCPHCKATHPCDTIRCTRSGRIRGRLVYRSLPSDLSGFIFLEETNGGVLAFKHPYDVLWMGGNKVAVLQGGYAAVYCFDSETGHWSAAAGQRIKPYWQIEGHTHVIVL